VSPRRHTALALLLLGALAATAAAVSAAERLPLQVMLEGQAPAAKASPARVIAGPAKPRVTPRAVAKPAPRDSTSSTSRGGRTAPRMLDDIHIEGEIPVPQVLFITAREQRRFMEFQHHRYTRTSLELGRGTAMPSRIVVPEPSPAQGKENQR